MKKLILSFAAFAALVSCTKENMPDNSQSAESFAITLQATAPGASDDTKTTLVDHSLVHWTKGDAIKVGFPASVNIKAKIENKTGVFASTFEEDYSANALFSTDSWNWYYNFNSYTGTYSDDINAYVGTGLAMYPSTVGFSSTRGGSSYQVETSIQYVLPTPQIAVQNSFKSDLCFSTAVVDKSAFTANNAQLSFKNECALIKIVLPEGVNDVVSINVASISGTPLVGKFYYYYLSFNEISLPVEFTITDGVESLDLNAPENETLTAGATYYMVVCPGKHSSGLAFTFTNVEGKTCRKEVSSNVVLEKSKIDEFKFKTITYEEKLDYNDAKVGDYFYSDGSFSTELDETKGLVGVVFYKGDQHMKDDVMLADSDYKHCTHGLVVSVAPATNKALFQNSFTTFEGYGKMSCLGYTYPSNKNANAILLTGYNNTQALISLVSTGYSSEAVDVINAHNRDKYVDGMSSWYLPSIAEADKLYEVYNVVNTAVEAATESSLSGTYWTVSLEDYYSSNKYAAAYVLSTKNFSSVQISQKNNVLPIFAF